MHIPECCGERMLVCADGVFECVNCEQRMTVNGIENAEEEAGQRRLEESWDRENDRIEAMVRNYQNGVDL